MKENHVAAGLVAILVAGAVACSTAEDRPTAAPPRPFTGAEDILVPERGALLGHYYGSGTISETDARIGRQPAVHLAYYDWAAAEATRTDLAAGRIPLINWEPFGVSFEDITAGRLDDTIAARAEGIKKLDAKVFLDFAAEMNEEEGWGGHSPATYVAGYLRRRLPAYPRRLRSPRGDERRVDVVPEQYRHRRRTPGHELLPG